MCWYVVLSMLGVACPMRLALYLSGIFASSITEAFTWRRSWNWLMRNTRLFTDTGNAAIYRVTGQFSEMV